MPVLVIVTRCRQFMSGSGYSVERTLLTSSDVAKLRTEWPSDYMPRVPKDKRYMDTFRKMAEKCESPQYNLKAAARALRFWLAGATRSDGLLDVSWSRFPLGKARVAAGVGVAKPSEPLGIQAEEPTALEPSMCHVSVVPLPAVRARGSRAAKRGQAAGNSSENASGIVVQTVADNLMQLHGFDDPTARAHAQK
jgi:hypothetical protein